MSLNLKDIVQSLDAHIAAVTTARDVLVRALTSEPALPVLPLPTIPAERVRPTGRAARPASEKRGGGVRPKRKATQAAPIEPEAKEAPGTPVIGTAPATVAGAMKLEIHGLNGREFTSDALRQTLEGKYGGEDWWKNASASALSGNLSYWSSKGRLEKTASGYKARDREFFANVEY